jgi:hypothetical protein
MQTLDSVKQVELEINAKQRVFNIFKLYFEQNMKKEPLSQAGYVFRAYLALSACL